MAAKKVPPGKNGEVGERRTWSDVVLSDPRAAESASEQRASADTAPMSGKGAAELAPHSVGLTVPAQVPFRMARVFSLHPGLMQVARMACTRVAARAEAHGRIRVWVPACKTGSTVYTITMLLLEAAPRLSPRDLMVFGTDTDESALALARAGRYPAGAALGMDSDLRARYTFDEGETIRVSEAMRQSCLFSRHDLGRDPPFPRLDLIVCQKVLHGVAPSKRAELARRLHHGLRHDGLLVAFDHPEWLPLDLFEPVARGCFRPREQPRAIRPCLSSRNESLQESHAIQKRRLDSARAALVPWPRSASDAYGDADELIRALGHPLIVCDSQLRILLMSSEAQRMFEFPEGGQALELATLVEALPGGHQVVSTARHVVAGQTGEDVVVRTGVQTYLVRARPALNGRGVSVAFTDVTLFEANATGLDREGST